MKTVRENAKEHVAAQINLVLEGSSKILDQAFRSAKMQVMFLASDSGIADNLESGKEIKVTSKLESLLKSQMQSLNFLGLVITNSDNTLLYSSDLHLSSRISDFKFDTPLRGLSNDQVNISQPLLLPKIDNGKEALGIAFVLRKNSGRSLWLIVNARAIFGAVLQSGRSGTTGEIYAVDRNGLMISDSRFNTHLYGIGLLQPGQESAMRILVRDPLMNLLNNRLPAEKDRLNWPLTKMVASVIKQQRGIDLDGYRDYRGVPVVGAWIWLDEFNFGLTHEMDYAEAFSHVSALEFVVISLVLALFVATIIASLSSMRISHAEKLEKQSQERLKELQTQIAQVNRLATMGELATGLAHEINQPLMAVSNYARAALNELDTSNAIDYKKLRERLSSVEKNALRAGEVIRRIRKFVSRGEIQAGAVNFNQLIKYPLEILAHEIKISAVKISLKVPKDLPVFWLDEIQIQQVFVNLIRNAIEAMQRAKSVKREIKIEVNIDEDQYVCISIRDSGPGISAEVRERLFEQFNSSNPNGMGLGLAISRRIIEAHQGVIDVESSPENGVHFLIRIPVQVHSENQSA